MIRTRKSIRDPKVLKDKIMAKLKEKGILNELQARFLSNISLEIQNSNATSLQPSRILREEKAYQIAGQIVLQFLKDHNFNNSIQSLQAETQGKISLNTKTDIVLLKCKKGKPIISQLKEDKLKNFEQYRQKYNQSLQNSIRIHVNNILNPPKPEPSPKKLTRSILQKFPILSSNNSAISEQKSPEKNKKSQNSSPKPASNSKEIPNSTPKSKESPKPTPKSKESPNSTPKSKESPSSTPKSKESPNTTPKSTNLPEKPVSKLTSSAQKSQNNSNSKAKDKDQKVQNSPTRVQTSPKKVSVPIIDDLSEEEEEEKKIVPSKPITQSTKITNRPNVKPIPPLELHFEEEEIINEEEDISIEIDLPQSTKTNQPTKITQSTKVIQPAKINVQPIEFDDFSDSSGELNSVKSKPVQQVGAPKIIQSPTKIPPDIYEDDEFKEEELINEEEELRNEEETFINEEETFINEEEFENEPVQWTKNVDMNKGQSPKKVDTKKVQPPQIVQSPKKVRPPQIVQSPKKVQPPQIVHSPKKDQNDRIKNLITEEELSSEISSDVSPVKTVPKKIQPTYDDEDFTEDLSDEISPVKVAPKKIVQQLSDDDDDFDDIEDDSNNNVPAPKKVQIISDNDINSSASSNASPKPITRAKLNQVKRFDLDDDDDDDLDLDDLPLSPTNSDVSERKKKKLFNPNSNSSFPEISSDEFESPKAVKKAKGESSDMDEFQSFD